MAVQKANNAGTFGRNNGGTVLYGGNIPTAGPITNAPGSSIVGQPILSPDNLPVRSGTKTTWATASQASLRQNQVLVPNITTALAGNSNSVLQRMDNNNTQPYHPHTRLTVDTVPSAIRAGRWHEISGKFVAGGISAFTGVNHGSDAPTLAIPGELVYLVGKKLPTQADYSARTN